MSRALGILIPFDGGTDALVAVHVPFVVMVVVCPGMLCFVQVHLPYPFYLYLLVVTSQCLHCKVTI